MVKYMNSTRKGFVILAATVTAFTALLVPTAITPPAAEAEPVSPEAFLAGDPIGRYIVVLGARIEPRGTPPPILEERLDRAVALSNAYPVNRIIVTGGNTWLLPISEATFMHLELVKRGIAPWQVIDEHTAMSTNDNAIRVVAMLKGLGASGAVIVTNGFHMPRAMKVFRAQAAEQQANLTFVPGYA